MLTKISKIESFATQDGAGIRAAVFMQGCNLRCIYCHNPETFSLSGGEEIDGETLINRLLRYKPYFSNGGGVTFTGGEPLLHADFLLNLIKKLKKQDINIAIDTNLTILNDVVKEVYNNADLVIGDLKFYNNKDYINYTGLDVFDTVLASLDYLLSIKKKVWIRTVIVPDINDKKEDIQKYKEITAKYSGIIENYQLLPFHTMGFSKYKQLDIINRLEDKKALSMEKLDELKKIL